MSQIFVCFILDAKQYVRDRTNTENPGKGNALNRPANISNFLPLFTSFKYFLKRQLRTRKSYT